MLNPSNFLTRTPLEDFSIRVTNDYVTKMATPVLFPVKYVPKKTGEIYQASRDHLRIRTADAPSGSEANSDDHDYFKKSFTLKEKAWKKLVLDKDARDFDRAVSDLDQEAAMFNMDVLMLEYEDAGHTKATTSTNYPSANVKTLVDNTDRWSDTGGDPLSNIYEMAEAVFVSCGKRPNTLVMAQKGLYTLRQNAAIRDQYKYTTPESITTVMLANLFEVERIVISDLVKNTANKGASDSLASVWGDDVVLAYVDPAASAKLRTMTYGVTLMGQNFYAKTHEKPELGRGNLGAHYLENGWEWAIESAAIVANGNDDFIAGALIENIF